MAESKRLLIDDDAATCFGCMQREQESVPSSTSKELLLRPVVRKYGQSRPRETAKQDLALLAGIRKGEPGALTALYKEYSTVVYSVSLRILRDPSAAEDVVQEIFMQIWRDPGVFNTERGSLAGWLAVLSRNRSIDLQRRRRPSESVDEVVLASVFDLAEAAEKNLLLMKVRAWTEQLSLQQQETLHMAFFDGLTHIEIAEKTGTPLGTIKTIIRRALQTLREAAFAAPRRQSEKAGDYQPICPSTRNEWRTVIEVAPPPSWTSYSLDPPTRYPTSRGVGSLVSPLTGAAGASSLGPRGPRRRLRQVQGGQTAFAQELA